VVLAQAYTPISNLGQATHGNYSGVGSGSEGAESFTTGPVAVLLSSVSLALEGSSQGVDGNEPGPLNVSLYADGGGVPGTNVIALVNSNGISTPLSGGVYTYVPSSSSAVLQPNTVYWLMADSSASIDEAYYWWSGTPETSLDAGSTWTLGSGDGFNTESGWYVLSVFHFSFSVSVINPNLPSLAISQPILLTYTNVGVPYTLQETTNLATTNWVPVTNTLFTDTISNQVIFILPAGAPQIYYRLHYP
jgi:hypothetical protein